MLAFLASRLLSHEMIPDTTAAPAATSAAPAAVNAIAVVPSIPFLPILNGRCLDGPYLPRPSPQSKPKIRRDCARRQSPGGRPPPARRSRLEPRQTPPGRLAVMPGPRFGPPTTTVPPAARDAPRGRDFAPLLPKWQTWRLADPVFPAILAESAIEPAKMAGPTRRRPPGTGPAPPGNPGNRWHVNCSRGPDRCRHRDAGSPRPSPARARRPQQP